MPGSIEKIPVWLDCDPGHDDAFALLFACHHPAIELLGVSTVHGNASLERTTQNAGAVLTALGKSDIPVYPGTRKPFCREAYHAPNIHGKTGLDGTDLLPTPAQAAEWHKNAILGIRDAILATPIGTAWIVATGTLTNVALLFATFPEVTEWIKGLSIMGGAVGDNFTAAPISRVPGDEKRIGNVTPWAEFNIYCDPEAAQSVLSNLSLQGKTTLITLDLTHQVLGTRDVLQRLLPPGSPEPVSTKQGFAPQNLRPLLHDILTFFKSTNAKIFGLEEGPPVHDPLAVAVVLEKHPDSHYRIAFDQDMVSTQASSWEVSVVTSGAHTDQDPGMLGRTVVKPTQPSLKPDIGIRIVRSVDSSKFWSSLLDVCLIRAE